MIPHGMAQQSGNLGRFSDSDCLGNCPRHRQHHFYLDPG
ncbi:hypothetical protein [Stutzerimonas stutzeri]